MILRLLALVLWVTPASALDLVLPPYGEDATTIFNAAVRAVCGSFDRTIKIRAGAFTFLTAPLPIPCGANVVCEGKGSTQLIRSYSGQGGAFLSWQRGGDPGGGSLRDCSILAGDGTSGGVAVYIAATADPSGLVQSLNRHNFLIDNVLIGRVGLSGSWDTGIYLDAASNPRGNPNSAPGVRGVFIRATTTAATSVASIYLFTADGLNAQVECYAPTAPDGHSIRINGATQGVYLFSNSCPVAWMDGASFGLSINGQPTGR